MARTLIIIFSLILIACASKKKHADVEFNYDMRNELFSTQENVENMIKLKDPFFMSLNKNECLVNWNDKVVALKEKLKKMNEHQKRAFVWFRLGNCYLYVKEYGQAILYFDLAISTGLRNKKILSTINYNMGQIYELNNQLILAESHYKKSLNYNDSNSFSRFKLAMLNHRGGEFKLSNRYLRTLKQRYKKSEIVSFLMGVNFFHLNDSIQLQNKVIKQLDEKSLNRVLLEMGHDLIEKKNTKDISADLKNLETNFSLQKDFKDLILTRIGN